ncbi:MAG: alkaline phosphatase family protein [Byssovorax sp.]
MKSLQTSLVLGALAALFVSACGPNGATTGSGSNSVGVTTGAGGSGGSTAGAGGAGGAGGASMTTASGPGGAAATSTAGSTTSSSGSTGTGGSGGFGTIFTIILENHDASQVVDSMDAPYINSLIGKYGLATSYEDSGSHPSLPNYLYLISGDTQFPFPVGVDVQPTQLQFPKDEDNLGNQLEVAGVNWRSYQEDMVTPCNLDPTADALYQPKHDPFLYFTNIQSNAAVCANRNVDYSLFPADLAAGSYKYMWITPNMTNNGHDPTGDPVVALKQSDLWLSHEVPKILASDAYKNNGVLFITWDEGTGLFGASSVAMIVISPKLKSAGMKVATPLSHASYLATVEEIFGLTKLGDAGAATDLMEFFAP